MKQRMIMALTALFTVMGSTFLPRLEAAALTTEQPVPHCHDDDPG